LQHNSAQAGAGGLGGPGGPGTAEGGTITGIFGGAGSTINLNGLGNSNAGGPGGVGGAGGAGGAASGGGVYVATGTLTLVTGTLAGNQALGGSGGAGGHGGTGGFGAATGTLGLPVGKTGGAGGAGGQAGPGSGGGIYVAGGKVVLFANTTSGNLAQGGKGGAGGTGGYGPIAALEFGGSFYFGTGSSGTGGTGGTSTGGGKSVVNTAGPGGNGGNGNSGKGGGLYVSGGAITLIDDTVAVNSVAAGASGSGGPGGKAGTGKVTGGVGAAGQPGDSYGGGLYVSGGAIDLFNSTVALNAQSGAGSGGGAVVQSPGTLTAASSLFGDNGVIDFSGNVTANDSLFQTAPINGSLTGSGNLVGVDPLLDTNGLQNNGGPTQTIALQSSSPAIGKGANPENLFADQRGYAPRSGPGGIDIGAYQTNALSDTQAPTATLNAATVTNANASALNPYTFTITYSDNVAVSLASLSNAVVVVLPPSGAPIAATVVSIQASGATDGAGNAASFVVTYQITPPGGSWTVADDGTYSVNLGGGAVTDLAGNAVAAGSLGTFSVQIDTVMRAVLTGPSDGYSGVAGQTRNYTLSVTGLTQAEQSQNVTYTLDWGDGNTSTLTVAGTASPQVSHVYSSDTAFSITLSVAAQDGRTGQPANSTDNILLYEIQGSTLAVGGTAVNNTFVVSAGAQAGSLIAKWNGTTIGPCQVSGAALYAVGKSNLATIVGVQNSADTFTLTGSTATFTAASLSPNVFAVALNEITQVHLQGGNSGNSFTITASTLPSVLVGGAGKNSYTFAGNQRGAAVNIVGSGTLRGNPNTLYGPTLAGGTSDVWTITGVNAGYLKAANCSFTGVQNLVGGKTSNDFVFQKGASESGTVTGNGVSELDYSSYGAAVYVNLLTSAATATGGIANITQVHGSGHNDVLVGHGNSALLLETAGNNLMIAGTGSSVTLDSGSGYDLVIAGSTTYDNNKTALLAIEAFWAAHATNSFAATVAALSAGISGGYKLTTGTVSHQGSGDTIVLGSTDDWVFWRKVGNNKDSLTGSPKASTFI
jgi:hypothetical protein